MSLQVPGPHRVAAALLFTVACALLPNGAWPWYAGAAAALVAAALAVRVRWAEWLKRLALAEPLAAGISLRALLLPDGGVRFASLLGRSTLCLGAMTLLSATTPFPAILDALRLFRDILLASSAIPGPFPPVYIEVEANGRRFLEMHVDGGVNGPMYVAPDSYLFPGADKRLPMSQLYVFLNGKVRPDFYMPARTTSHT